MSVVFKGFRRLDIITKTHLKVTTTLTSQLTPLVFFWNTNCRERTAEGTRLVYSLLRDKWLKQLDYDRNGPKTSTTGVPPLARRQNYILTKAFFKSNLKTKIKMRLFNLRKYNIRYYLSKNIFYNCCWWWKKVLKKSCLWYKQKKY